MSRSDTAACVCDFKGSAESQVSMVSSGSTCWTKLLRLRGEFSCTSFPAAVLKKQNKMKNPAINYNV